MTKNRICYPTPDAALAARTVRKGDCLEWTGGKSRKGYGRISVNGKIRSVHRYAWERTNGLIPDDMVVDHICHNRACVNVEHLRLATAAQNQANRSGPAGTRDLPRGVRKYRETGRFVAQVASGGRYYYGGIHDTVQEASEAADAIRARLFGAFKGKGVK